MKLNKHLYEEFPNVFNDNILSLAPTPIYRSYTILITRYNIIIHSFYLTEYYLMKCNDSKYKNKFRRWLENYCNYNFPSTYTYNVSII